MVNEKMRITDFKSAFNSRLLKILNETLHLKSKSNYRELLWEAAPGVNFRMFLQ